MLKKVYKYGGSSLRSHSSVAQSIEQAKLELAAGNQLIEVLSAPGKKQPAEQKMTDQVKKLALGSFDKDSPKEAELKKISEHFIEIYKDFGLEAQAIEEHCKSEILKSFRSQKTKSSQGLESLENQKRYAALVSGPERINAKLRVDCYNKLSIPAHYLGPEENLFVHGSYLNAQYNLEKSKSKIAQEIKKHSDKVIVRPGFHGVNSEGDYALFPRGGSDITGAIDAEAANADLYRNCTDVNGVMEVDPRLFADESELQKKIKSIPHLSYDEIEELAVSGASVIHPMAISPLRRANIPLEICNSFDINGEKTLVNNLANPEGPLIKGIAYLDGLSHFTLHSPDMIGQSGYVEKFSEAFKKHLVEIEMVFTSPTVIVANTQSTENLDKVSQELKKYGEVYCGQGTGMLSIVGEGYNGDPRVAMRFLSALLDADESICIHRQTQALKCSYWVSIDQKYLNKAAKMLYKKFFGELKNKEIAVYC